MRPEVNAISGRLSLRKPQREGLEILDRVMEITSLGRRDAGRRQASPVQAIPVFAPSREDGRRQALPVRADPVSAPSREDGRRQALPVRADPVSAPDALEAIRSEYPHVTDFERDFPSLCFALATGVGKTRLMGAFISYLHTAHKIDNFFVLAPNLTIYNKLIADFTPGTPKYVFRGVSAFATSPPDVITGDTWESYAGGLFDALVTCRINIFNISKINTEVRGGKAPRIKRLSEYIGESYFEWLSKLPDLVLLMDESHRYRATAGVRAINELNPILGLELTATPYVTSGSRTEPFKNVIQDYSLRRAMEDGFVKEPAVVTRQNLRPGDMSTAELERMKLEDGIRLHEQTKVELDTYARNSGQPRVKPFVLVIARDTTHAAELLSLIQSDRFFEGRYAGKAIQVDSSGTGAERDETIEKLLKVEQSEDPTEIVIHVNMLKEGWDVTNLYTIVPLRAANAKVLIEQTIGRGLRLPYGKRTGVAEVDRLSIVAHDKFQEIVDEANRSDSIIQMRQIVLSDADLEQKTKTVVIRPTIEARLGLSPDDVTDTTAVANGKVVPLYTDASEKAAAKVVYEAIERLQRNPNLVPDITYITRPEVQERLVREVEAGYTVGQLGLDGIAPVIDVARVVEDVSNAVVDLTISIPRIVVVPVGELRSGFNPFDLDLSSFTFQAVDEDLWSQELRTGAGVRIGVNGAGAREQRLEDYVIGGLVDFDEISYDDHAELLQDLATQVVDHFRGYLDEEQIERVLRVHQRPIARAVFSQMLPHYWEDSEGGFETRVSAGFTPIKEAATKGSGEVVSVRVAPANLAELQRTVYGGFTRCLQTVQKFDSNQERMLAIILDRESQKWFRPAAGQFQITYRRGIEFADYQPDFVAELDDRIVMLEPKRVTDMEDPEVLAKKAAAVAWCRTASEHSAKVGGKPWQYALIPHDAIAENQTLDYLLRRFAIV